MYDKYDVLPNSFSDEKVADESNFCATQRIPLA